MSPALLAKRIAYLPCDRRVLFGGDGWFREEEEGEEEGEVVPPSVHLLQPSSPAFLKSESRLEVGIYLFEILHHLIN